MSYTTVLFKWSDPKLRNNDYTMTSEEYRNKAYKYFYKGVPIRFINSPYIVANRYLTSIGLINENFTTEIVDINDILTISELRDNKLEELGI